MGRKLLIMAALFSAQLLAVGTVTQILERKGETDVYLLTLTWTADGSDGSVPITTLLRSGTGIANTDGFSIIAVETDPGGTAPTDNYDIEFLDDSGGDLLGGECLNRDTANTEFCSQDARPIRGNVAFKLTNNSVNGATGIVYVYLARQTVARRGGSSGGGGSTTISAVASGEQIVATGTDTTHAQKGLVGGTGIVASADSTTITFSRDPAVLISRTVSASNPVDGTDSCAEGDLWWNSTTDLMWVCQSNSNTWKRQPLVVATTAPAACSVGELFFDSDATAGSNLFGCTATDTWTALGGGGGVGFVLSTSYIKSTIGDGISNYYFAPFITSQSTDEQVRVMVMPTACTARNLYVCTHTTMPADTALIMTVRQNEADSALSLTIPAGSVAGCYSATADVSFSAGDRFGWRGENSGAGTVATAQIKGISTLCN